MLGARQREARRLCRGCAVRTECLAHALDHRIEFGVWGGMTERERRALLRNRPDVRSWTDLLADARDAHYAPPPPPRRRPTQLAIAAEQAGRPRPATARIGVSATLSRPRPGRRRIAPAARPCRAPHAAAHSSPIRRSPSRSATSPATTGTWVTGTSGCALVNRDSSRSLAVGQIDPVGVQPQHRRGQRGAAQAVGGGAGPGRRQRRPAPGACG